MKRLVLFGTLVAASFAALPASAHIELSSPAARYDDQKDGPCGRGTADKRGTKPTVLKPGSTITVKWTETVPHPGHYRISFDPKGQSFTDPKSYDDRNTDANVLIDGIKDESGTKSYTQEVKLPDVECDKCTLQIIQMMTDKPPYGDGNDLYFQCADITLSNAAGGEEVPAEEADAGATPASRPVTQPSDSGCASSPGRGSETSLLVIAVAALFGIVRRRAR